MFATSANADFNHTFLLSLNTGQDMAKTAKRPWLEADILAGTEDKNFGVNVVVYLVLHFQMIARDGREPALRDGLEKRIETDSPLALSCGPYSKFLLRTLLIVVNTVTNNQAFCKVRHHAIPTMGSEGCAS